MAFSIAYDEYDSIFTFLFQKTSHRIPNSDDTLCGPDRATNDYLRFWGLTEMTISDLPPIPNRLAHASRALEDARRKKGRGVRRDKPQEAANHSSNRNRFVIYGLSLTVVFLAAAILVVVFQVDLSQTLNLARVYSRGTKAVNYNYSFGFSPQSGEMILVSTGARRALSRTGEVKAAFIAQRIPDVGYNQIMKHQLARDIVELSEAAGMEPFFIASVISAESSFRQNALSPAGAVGLMQLLPSTALGVSKNVGAVTLSQVRISDNRINIALGIEYLRILQKQFRGDQRLMLAAYNWGPGNVEKVNRDWSRIPRSVKQYANKITSKQHNWQQRFSRT